MQGPIPTERAFGTSVGGACVALGALLAWRGSQAPAMTLAAAGGLLMVLARAAPSLLRAPNRWWWRFAQVLGWINARVLLTLFFVLVLTPVGVMMRVFGRNVLRPPRVDTSWGPYPARRRDVKHYERMF
jgi:hypothetical protein